MPPEQISGDSRTLGQLREHYEVEKALATALRNAPREERRRLYSSLYDELYRRVPLHPQLTRQLSDSETQLAVRSQLRFLNRFLKDDITFLEVGSGDCALAVAVSNSAKQVYAVDVSHAITESLIQPPNLHLVIFDGITVPVPPNSVDIAYSNQLMEHLHPDDIEDQLEGIYNALVPGGAYVCITPNRLDGPHDVSKYFDREATGFHLKEYSTAEVSRLFRRAGFSRVYVYIGAKGIYAKLPTPPVVLYETMLNMLPYRIRMLALRFWPLRLTLGTRFVGVK